MKILGYALITAGFLVGALVSVVEELEEFADSVRGKARPEVGGDTAIESLAVIRAGILSTKERRHVPIQEILASDK